MVIVEILIKLKINCKNNKRNIVLFSVIKTSICLINYLCKISTFNLDLNFDITHFDTRHVLHISKQSLYFVILARFVFLFLVIMLPLDVCYKFQNNCPSFFDGKYAQRSP